MTAAPLPSPLPHRICPLCGGANQCAPAEAGTFSVACWCSVASISLASLARVPEALRGTACLCPSCAGAAPRGGPTGGGSAG